MFCGRCPIRKIGSPEGSYTITPLKRGSPRTSHREGLGDHSMREITSKAAAEESATGLMKGDMAKLHAATPLPMAEGSYRVRSVPQGPTTRPATIVRLAAGSTRVRGSLTALSVGAVSLAVLAGPATCPSCNVMHADGPLALSFSTAAIGPALEGVLDGPPTVAAVETTSGTRKLPDTIQQLTRVGRTCGARAARRCSLN